MHYSVVQTPLLGKWGILSSVLKETSRPLSGPAQIVCDSNLLLLHGYADVVHIHVGEVSVAVLVVIEVDTNGLTFVRSQGISNHRPGPSVGEDLQDLRRRGTRSILHLGLLPVVGDGVGRGGPIPEGEGRLGCGTGN